MDREQLIKEISDLVKCECSPECKMLDTDKDYPSIVSDFILSHTEELRKENEELKVSDAHREMDLFTANRKVDRLKALVDTYKEYIKMLGDELDELVPMAHNHGWRSSRVEAGEKLRDKIAEFKEGK